MMTDSGFCGWCEIFVIVYALEGNVKYHELLDINKENCILFDLIFPR
jgi:hypothetical protein